MTWPRPVPVGGDRTSAAQRAADPAAWAFDKATIAALHDVIRARRVVRRYRPDPVPPPLVREILDAGHCAPSVGHSQPWRFIVVAEQATRDRAALLADRERLRQADQLQPDRRARLLDLQLEGIRSPLLAAALVVAGQAMLTRGLHLDVLADLADGLGSRRPAPAALAVMRRPDVGAFGVAAVVFDLLVQVAALTAVFGQASRPAGVVSVATATVTGRVAVVLAARRSVPAARPDGFGALAAGTVSRAAGTSLAGCLLAAAVGARWAAGASLAGAVAAGAAVLAGLVAAGVLRAHAVRRLGGVTGDVFGALVEVASALTLVGLAVVAAWT